MPEPRLWISVKLYVEISVFCLVLTTEGVDLAEAVGVGEAVHPSEGVGPNGHPRGVAEVVRMEKTQGVEVEQIQAPDFAMEGEGQDSAKEVVVEHQTMVGVGAEDHVPQVPGEEMVQAHLRGEGVVDHQADEDEEDLAVGLLEVAADQVLPMVEQNYC